MIQMSLVQIDNYGPWTVDPAPKREADIQILQSSFYADVQHQFSSRDGLAFATRFDNILAISNGIDKEAHLRIQQSLHARYPFTLSIGVGAGRTALEAQEEATRHIHKAGSAQSSRTAVVEGSFLDSGQVDIGHFDIDDATGTITDVLSTSPLPSGYVSSEQPRSSLVGTTSSHPSTAWTRRTSVRSSTGSRNMRTFR